MAPRVLFALLLALSLTGCRLLAGGVACEIDENCPDELVCAENACVEPGPGEGEGEGEPVDAGGEDSGMTGEGEGEGEGEGDGGPSDGGFDAGPQISQDAGPPVCDDVGTPTVYPDNVTVTDAASLAVLDGVHVLDGHLTIHGVSQDQVISLPDLRVVEGDVEVRAAGDEPGPFTITVDAPCLDEVRSLDVRGERLPNPSFPALRAARTSLELEDVTSADFPRLASAGNRLEITASSLADLDGFPGLIDLGGVWLFDNPNLVDIDALANLTELMTNGLRLNNNDTLPSVAALANLQRVRDDSLLQLFGDVIPQCELEQLRDRLVAAGFRGAVSLGGLSNDAACTFPGEPCPPQGDGVASCDAPVAIVINSNADVAQYLNEDCASSVTIAGTTTDVCLPKLEHVQGDLIATEHQNTLVALRLPNLDDVDGQVRIDGGDGTTQSLEVLDLRRLDDMASLDLVWLNNLPEVYLPEVNEVSGAVRVNDTTAALVYLPELRVVTGEARFGWHEAAETLYLPRLNQPQGGLRIESNPALTHFDGLANDFDAQFLIIQDNDALPSLAGLNPDTITGDVEIRGNALLGPFGIDPGAFTLGGTLRVINNGCLTDEEANDFIDQTATPVGREVRDNAWGTGCPVRTHNSPFDGSGDTFSGLWGSYIWPTTSDCFNRRNNGVAEFGCSVGSNFGAGIFSRTRWDISDGVQITYENGPTVGDLSAANGGLYIELEFPDTNGQNNELGYWEAPSGYGFGYRVEGANQNGSWTNYADNPAKVTHLRMTYDGTDFCGYVSTDDGASYAEHYCAAPPDNFDLTAAQVSVGIWLSDTSAALTSVSLDEITLEPLP